jgi:hypothetical protein
MAARWQVTAAVVQDASMHYYHDEARRTVYAVQDPPSVHTNMETKTKRRKYPKRLGCTVSARIVITRADNYLTPQGRWAHPLQGYPQQTYDSRDSDVQAAQMFRSLHLVGFGQEISKEEYDVLHEKYKAEAEANKPPSP